MKNFNKVFDLSGYVILIFAGLYIGTETAIVALTDNVPLAVISVAFFGLAIVGIVELVKKLRK